MESNSLLKEIAKVKTQLKVIEDINRSIQQNKNIFGMQFKNNTINSIGCRKAP